MMKKRSETRNCIIYPESQWKIGWDIFVSIILVYSCFIIPLQVCFNYENRTFLTISNLIDWIFAADIIVIFNTAITTEEYKTVDDRKEIAINYL